MRAIETRYKGRLFRSRLEARYAVLFDALHITWDYEPEGFELPDGTRYLPDFWMPLAADDPLRPEHPEGGYWVEIKAGDPTAGEDRRMRLLTMSSGHSGYLFAGPPDRVVIYSYHRTGRRLTRHNALHAVLGSIAAFFRPLPVSTFNTALSRALSARFEFGGRA